MHHKPLKVGPIKRLALWYRLPDFADRFFVFGEFHSGVLGREIQAESNLDMPTLDEARTGWTSGAKAGPSAPSTERAAPTGAKPLPDLPEHQSRTRITDDGSHRLVVRGGEGKPELWKPKEEPESPPVYGNEGRACRRCRQPTSIRPR